MVQKIIDQLKNSNLPEVSKKYLSAKGQEAHAIHWVASVFCQEGEIKKDRREYKGFINPSEIGLLHTDRLVLKEAGFRLQHKLSNKNNQLWINGEELAIFSYVEHDTYLKVFENEEDFLKEYQKQKECREEQI